MRKINLSQRPSHQLTVLALIVSKKSNKTMKYILAILFILVKGFTSLAQDTKLFQFPQIQDAVSNGTRTIIGEPGPRYWQNNSDYTLEVTIDTSTNILSGKGSIIYHNNSPYKIYNIFFRLYQDLYKKGTLSNLEVSPDDLHDGTFLDSISINGITYIRDNKVVSKNYLNRLNTTLHISMNDPILSGGTGVVQFAWNFPIPASHGIRRMGRYADNYFIGLWYPQIAVLDDIGSWDELPHLGAQEFYNDFNNYDVTINVPNGYMVWATGECNNLVEVLDKTIISKLDYAQSHDSLVAILSPEDYKNSPAIGNKWHFKAQHVPDFAFAACTKYLWKGTSVIVDTITNRRVFVDIVYPEDTIQYGSSLSTAKETIKWASTVFPGVPFPYAHATSFFNGFMNGLSMEFPMITNDMTYENTTFSNFVVAHELLHNYMPFYMGINETMYGWMDEGWACFMENKFNADSSALTEGAFEMYPYYAGRRFDQPLIYATTEANADFYNFHAYTKSQINLILLEELLGKDVFLKATRAFMMSWNGKHPSPFDFFYTFNRVSGQNLDWFWRACYFDFGYADLAIKSVEKNKIIIEKKGSVPVSIKLVVTYDDNSTEKIYKNLKIWKNGATEYTIKLNTKKTIKNISLGDNRTPDYDEINNFYQK